MTANILLNDPISNCEFKKVGAIEFGILSPEALNKLSVCEVHQTELYDSNKNPVRNGLNDLRMGSLDDKKLCQTCNGQGSMSCPGHFGSVTLAEPMYHIGFMSTVLKILQSVCFNCQKLLCINGTHGDKKLMALQRISRRADRFKAVIELCKKGSVHQYCTGDNNNPGCGSRQPKFEKDISSAKLLITPPPNESGVAGTRKTFYASAAHKVLRNISDSTCRLMGLDPERAHPSWMIVTVLPVPPPAVRPSVQAGSVRSEDDLTMKFLDLLKMNKQIQKQIVEGAAGHQIEANKDLLQFHVFTIVNNGIPGLPIATTKSHKPIKSITQRLKGKEGRLRGNLMGKRVDFSARTVITGDPSLMIDQVGVPRSVAMTLTFPEKVTPLNKQELLNLVQRGPSRYPGARYVIIPEGGKQQRYDLRFSRFTELPVGAVVERHLRDDDLVLFNRQPSLHKMSIMGHRAKVLPFSTFRLNLSVTSPYNADFDGDEMNLHLAQSHETRAEIRHLMMNPKQIVSPQGNKPVMGIVQDTLLGVSKMTKKDTFLRKYEMMNLLMWLPSWDGVMPEPAILKPEPLWTGKQVFTLLLQEMRISIEKGNNLARKLKPQEEEFDLAFNGPKYCRYDDCHVLLHDGELLCGVIDKKCVGAAPGSAVHLIWLEYGPEKAKEFLSWTQTLINHWLLHNGFSVGCADIIANQGTLDRVGAVLLDVKTKVKDLVIKAQKGELESQPGKTMLQTFEADVNITLSHARSQSGNEAIEALDDRNNIIAMVLSGSKGSNLNISQIIACVGQQNVEGKRMPFGFERRTLPHFIKDDHGPESRGFVENSYLAGLTPQEFYFHAMGGREGVIDTACKTAETGYIQRRLIKAMEDARVHYDRTVRTGNGEVLQFLYGEDGMAGEFIEGQTLTLMNITLDQLASGYKHNVEDPSWGFYGKGPLAGQTWLSESSRTDIQESKDYQTVLADEYERLVEAKKLLCTEVFPSGESGQYLPINMSRLIETVKKRVGNEDPCELSPVEVVTRVEETLTNLKIAPGADSTSIEVQSNATKLLYAHIRTMLNSRQVLERHRLGPLCLGYVLDNIVLTFNRSLAAPGEVVGTIAAQSVGEPATQMTLNTFHNAGIGSKNVTLGVPRLKEIINIATNLKTPSLSIALDSEHRGSETMAQIVGSRLEHTMMERVTKYTQILYDPELQSSVIEADRDFVEDYYQFSSSPEEDTKLTPWVLRMVLRKNIIDAKKIQMKQIHAALFDFWRGDNFQIIYTDDNRDELVVRLRLHRSVIYDDEEGGEGEDSTSPLQMLQQMENRMLTEMSLCGVEGISKVYMREDKESRLYHASTGKFEKLGGHALDTEGCNLRGIACIEGVDFRRCSSNDITEVLQVLGIEAARRALFRELHAVLSFDSSYVNHRHIALLCDAMTFRGSFMAITRHGLNRGERGALAKASFEETVDILMDAAAMAETDKLAGVSEPIILGQLCKLGTGSFDLLIDTEMLGCATSQDVAAGRNMVHRSDGESTVVPNSDMTSETGLTYHSPLPVSPIVSPNVVSGAPHTTMRPISTMNAFSTFGAVSPIVSPGAQVINQAAMTPMVGNRSRIAPTSVNPVSPRGHSPTSPMNYSPTSPGQNVVSPGYSPTSPGLSPTSPMTRQKMHMAQSRGMAVSPMAYSPTSPNMAAVSPHFSPTSPMHAAASPISRAPNSPGAMISSGLSPQYSPTSPMYSPTSPIARK